MFIFKDRVAVKPQEQRDVHRCPACDELECLCRPRFFAGQLLTEDDLNRLQRYVIEKNKLHNRYLHGWGVVCGLDVVCSSCEGFVTVKSGYALSPCGEDIVVCRDESVNVCKLINDCRDDLRTSWDCEPPRPNDPNCRDAIEEWVLAVRYVETPSRGVTALRNSGGGACSCGARCSCGGSSGCGCGGKGGAKSNCGCGASHAKSNAAAKSSCRPATRNPPLQCEPTVTCEGYVFEVYQAPVKKPERERDRGALIERMLACIQAWAAAIPQFPPNANGEQMLAWCCAVKDILLDLLATHGIYDCALLEQLSKFVCPQPSANMSPDGYRQQILTSLATLAEQFIRYCLCSALLPPCPETVSDPRVPLATISVRRHDCRIVRVCVWEHRRVAVTVPALGYWLSPLTPLLQNIEQALVKLCCTPPQRRQNFNANLPRSFVAQPNVLRPENKLQDFFSLFADALRNEARTVDAQTLFFGAVNATDAAGQPFMTETELRNPAEFLLINQMLAPLFKNLAPVMQSRTPGDEEIDKIKRDMAELQTTVRAQQAEIERLRSHPPNG